MIEKIYVDIDDTIADLLEPMTRAFSAISVARGSGPISTDDVTYWDYFKDKFSEKDIKRVFSGVFPHLRLKDGAENALKSLVSDDRFDVHLLSATAEENQPIRNKWLKEVLPWFPMDKVIYDHDKEKYSDGTLIDDGWHNAEKWGGRVFLISMPHNQGKGVNMKSITRVGSFVDAVDLIMSEEKTAGEVREIKQATRSLIEKDVATMLANSHEYKNPNVDGALALTKNYKWQKTSLPIEKLQGIDKPINKKKVAEIAKTLEQNGDKVKWPFIVVDKIHGIRPQSFGKRILLDGHHRLEACKERGIRQIPVYLGTFTGGAQKPKKELREKTAGIRGLVEKYASVQNDATVQTGKGVPKVKSVPTAPKPPKIKKIDLSKNPLQDNPNMEIPKNPLSKTSGEITFGTMDKRRAEKIINAAGVNQMVEIKYKDSKGNVSTRMVEPYKLDQNEFWAYDPEKEGIRHFKLKNIKALKPAKATYEPRWSVEMNKIAREAVKERALEKLAFMGFLKKVKNQWNGSKEPMSKEVKKIDDKPWNKPPLGHKMDPRMVDIDYGGKPISEEGSRYFSWAADNRDIEGINKSLQPEDEKIDPNKWNLLANDGMGNYVMENKIDGTVHFIDHEKGYQGPEQIFKSVDEYIDSLVGKQASIKERAIEKLAFMSREEKARANRARNWEIPEDKKKTMKEQTKILSGLNSIPIGSSPTVDNIRANIQLASLYYGGDPKAGVQESKKLDRAKSLETKAGRAGGALGALAAIPAGIAVGNRVMEKSFKNPKMKMLAGAGTVAGALALPSIGKAIGKRTQLSKYKDVDVDKLEDTLARKMIAVNEGARLARENNILNDDGSLKDIQLTPDANGRLNYKVAALEEKVMEKLGYDKDRARKTRAWDHSDRYHTLEAALGDDAIYDPNTLLALQDIEEDLAADYPLLASAVKKHQDAQIASVGAGFGGALAGLGLGGLAGFGASKVNPKLAPLITGGAVAGTIGGLLAGRATQLNKFDGINTADLDRADAYYVNKMRPLLKKTSRADIEAAKTRVLKEREMRMNNLNTSHRNQLEEDRNDIMRQSIKTAAIEGKVMEKLGK